MKQALLATFLAVALTFSATAAASSPSAYRTHVNGICATGVKQLRSLPEPKKPGQYYSFFKRGAEMSDRLLAKVTAVKPPSSLKAAVADAVAKQAAFEKALHGLVNRLKTSTNPKQTVQSAVPQLDGLIKKANKAWIAAGLVQCGS